jgi:gliding motility-associated GldM-like protein
MKKLIYLRYLILFIFSAFVTSCSHKPDNNFMILKALNERLAYSNYFIQHSSSLILRSLEDKLTDRSSHYKASIYFPKAMLVKQYSDSLTNYIGSLKQELILNSGFNNADSTYKLDNKDASTLVFETNDKGKELQAKLDKFKEDIMTIDTGMAAQFANINPEFRRDPFSNEGQDFNHIYTVAAFAKLNMIQNKILILENSILNFCNDQVPPIDCGSIKI